MPPKFNFRKRFTPAAQATAPSPLIPLLLAIGCLALNFIYAPISIILGALLVSLLIWYANASILPALLVLPLSKSDFLLSGYGTYEHSVEQFFSNSVILFGFPITITYALGASVMLRVLYEWVRNPLRFTRLNLKWYLILWLGLMALTLLMSYQGFIERNPAWTAPFRGAMMAGCIFYGVILRANGGGALVTLNWIVPMSAIFFGLASIGYFHQQYLWVLAGMCIPLAIFAFRNGTTFHKLTAAASMFTVTLYTLGLAPGVKAVASHTEHLSGLLGTGSSTFTLNALFAFSAGMAILATLRIKRLRLFFARMLGAPAFVASILFSLIVAWGSPSYATHRQERVSEHERTLGERFMSKLFDDRSIIWYGMLTDSLNNDQILRPSGRPVIFSHPVVGEMIWIPGAHNAYFEALRSYRLLGGSVMIAFLGFLLIRNAGVLGSSPDEFDRAAAAGMITVGIVVGVTGHMIISGDAMFWYFIFTGFVIAGHWAPPVNVFEPPARPDVFVRKSAQAPSTVLPVGIKS